MSTGRYELIGAVSWGRNCAKSFGVYADVPCKISLFHLLDKHNICIFIRSFLGNQMIFVFIFGHQNTIRLPLLLVPENCVIYSATISYYSLYFATYFRLPPLGDRNSGHSLHCLASGSAFKSS